MIILSGVLVVLAIALLVAGIVAGADGVGGIEGLTLIYISIGISVVSALCLLVGVFLRRKELFGPTGAVVAPKAKAPKPGRAARKAQQARLAREAATAPAEAPGPDGHLGDGGTTPHTEPFEEVSVPAQPVDVPSDAAVWVVRGRKRYHLESCRQLAGRDKEELTYEEAIEEGFSPCTACMPDTALAARAAVSVGESTMGAAESSAADSADVAAPSAIPPAVAPTEEFGFPPAPAAPASPAQEPLSGPTADEHPLGGVEDDRPVADPLSGGYGVPAPAAGYAPTQPSPLPNPWESPEGAETRHDVPLVQAASAFAPPKPATPADDEPVASAASDEPLPESGPLVRILSGTKRYHRPDCALIEDIGDEADDLDVLTRDEAKARGCTPCLVCQPDKDKPID